MEELSLPMVWVLWHRRIGDYRQMQALAQALEWPWIAKRLHFRSPAMSFLAPWLVERAKSDLLRPPWPDVILCAEALCVPIARQLKRQSEGRTKIVVLGRPPGATADYDLILTTAQYRLPPAANIVELDLPLILEPPDAQLAIDRSALKAPVTTVLVGGSSAPDWLDAAVADEMGEALVAHARRTGGTLLVTTSPRTGPAVTEALRRRFEPPHRVLAYRASPDNPYWGLIRLADEVVVTSDSVSMVADAVSAGRTVSVYRLPERRTPIFRLSEWLREKAVRRDSLFSRSIARLFDSGLIEATADRRGLFAKLAAEGRLSWFGQAAPAANDRHGGNQDMAVAAAKVKALLSGAHS